MNHQNSGHKYNRQIQAYKSEIPVGSLPNHVFVVTRAAAESGKMFFKVNVATAETHTDNELIVNVICDTGSAYTHHKQCPFLGFSVHIHMYII